MRLIFWNNGRKLSSVLLWNRVRQFILTVELWTVLIRAQALVPEISRGCSPPRRRRRCHAAVYHHQCRLRRRWRLKPSLWMLSMLIISHHLHLRWRLAEMTVLVPWVALFCSERFDSHISCCAVMLYLARVFSCYNKNNNNIQYDIK